MVSCVTCSINKQHFAMKKNYLIFCLLLLGLAGCMEPLYQLHPTANEYILNEGRKVVKQAKGGVKIVTAFDGEFQNYLVFDTEFFNQTDKSLEVNPANFVAYPLDKQRDSLRNERNPTYALAYGAADPDQKIVEAEQDMRRAEKRHKFATVLTAVLLVANVVSDVSSSGKSRNAGEWTRNRIVHDNNYQLLAVKQSVDNAMYLNRMNRLDYERGNWHQEPFRKQALLPGTSIRGRIYVPKHQQATFWLLSYPLDNGTISFEFE